MNCPYCEHEFKLFIGNTKVMPDIAPCVCEKCGNISMYDGGVLYRLNSEQIEHLKQAPLWKEFIEPALAAVKKGQS